jgi:hypothetical protein
MIADSWTAFVDMLLSYRAGDTKASETSFGRGLLCAAILAAVVCFSSTDRAAADTFGSGANTFDIEFVAVGDPGSAADTTRATTGTSIFASKTRLALSGLRDGV